MRQLFALLLLFVSHQVWADSNTEILRVGMFTDFPPYAFSVAGELQGVEVEMANLLSARLGRQLEITPHPFEELIQKLENGEVDIVMSGLSVTEERSERVSFAEPYLEIGQMAIIHMEEAPAFASSEPLARPGIKIGVQRGSTGEIFVIDSFPQAELVAYNGVEDGLEAIRAKRIDAFVHDSTTSWQLGGSFVNDKLLSLNRLLTNESIAWAVNKEDAQLLLMVNLILKDLKEERAFSEVLSRYLPEIPTASQ